jgi:hypothetical protein
MANEEAGEPPSKEDTYQKVLRVIEDDYLNDFYEIFEFTLRITNEIPPQANNEIRNALNHLARAVGNPAGSSVPEELRKARRHLTLAKRDCLKISILHKETLLAKIIAAIEENRGVEPTLRRRMIVLRGERRDISNNEIKGTDASLYSDDEATDGALETLLTDQNKFHEYLEDNFRVPDPKVLARHQLGRRYRKAAQLTSFSISCSLIAALIFALVFPDNTAVRSYFNEGIIWVAGHLTHQKLETAYSTSK